MTGTPFPALSILGDPQVNTPDRTVIRRDGFLRALMGYAGQFGTAARRATNNQND